jgi:ABC-type antimicrobial peptide transport system permease subunit
MLPQMEFVRQHTIRERLLAMLSLFFAIVAVVLAAVGLYGVLNYSVVQRRREIGIRMALGAPSADVARSVITQVFAMVLVGAFAGLAAGVGARHWIETLLYGVKPTETLMLALPAVLIFVTALLAALPPILQAVRIEPATTLRME